MILGRWKQIDLTLSCHPGDKASLPDLVSNLLLFIPWGFLVYANMSHGPARAVPKVLVCLVLGSLLSLSVETCQLFTRNRTTSLVDVAMNSVGTLVGGGMATVFFPSCFQRLIGFVQRDLRQQPVALILGLYLLLLSLDSMLPFDISIDMSNVKRHLSLFTKKGKKSKRP